MEAGIYISKPEIINNNNNNNRNKNKNSGDFHIFSKKKWSISTLSSLSESSNLSDFRSTGDLSSCDYNNLTTNSYQQRRESFDVPRMNSYQRRESFDIPRIKEEEKKKGRRKSWHVGKFEKKRRKGIPMLGSLNLGSSNHSSGSASPPQQNGFERHKKLSWWNIFVPDHWPKSRRASTDFTKLPTEKIPYVRGKSRSVDHGFSSPFDLESLRSKVESRFESVDRLCKNANGDSCSGSKENLIDKKMPKPPPPRTITYKVESNDTLTSVAARFDTTPSELAILNRLPSRTVFPGQIIRVPDKSLTGSQDGDNAESTSEGGADSTSGHDDVTSEADNNSSRVHSESDTRDPEDTTQDDILDTLRPSSPKPGYPERVHSPAPVPLRRNIERFLKINVRHVTDGQGVVGGVLLVTPNAIMFDPNVSDQLVIEHGPESYGVIAPMEFVVNAAIYHDIAHMRVANAQNVQPDDSGGKPEIYHTEVKECDRLYRPKEEQIPEILSEQLVDPVDKDYQFSSQLVTKETDFFDSLDPLSPGKPSSQHSSGQSEQRAVSTVKDEMFSEHSCKSSEESSICSCDDGDSGNVFQKTFNRDLMAPGYYSKRTLKRSDELSEKDSSDERRTDSPASLGLVDRDENLDNTMPHLVEAEAVIRNLEERRKSSLDHHWAIPNKVRSVESESLSRDNGKEGENDNLGKPPCHDSGIDIRDDPSFVATTKKSVYSDADIILADTNEFVPPIPVRQLSRAEDDTTTTSSQKKTSVSFSIDDNKESDKPSSSAKSSSEESDKQQESKKNKMLKRLSYPLAWMEGITGDKDDKESLPSSAESSHPSHSSSVFSKVFSSSPINMVTDFGSGLFLTKTPSEETGGNKFQFPPSNSSSPNHPNPTTAHNYPESGHLQRSATTISSVSSEPLPLKKEVFANFSPSSIIHSVGRSSVSSFIRQQHSARSDSTKSAGPRLDYRSMVSVEDMPELFVSFDIHAPMFPQLDHIELIPRPARSCEDPPLYLRLRMGKPKYRKIPKTTTIMSYGKKKMRPEYWFSVPRNRIDDLYRFLNLWVPHLYGDLDEKVVEERGYELVSSDTEIWDDEDSTVDPEKRERKGSGEIVDLTRESWEVIKAPYAKIYHLLKNQADQFGSSDTQPDEVLSMSEELRRALYASNTNSLDLELFLPDLNGATEILTEEHRKQLCRHLPARAEGYTWTLVFSTSQNGFSLNSMYRKMNKIDSPILMVIQDTDSNVFGTITSCALKVSDHFYGNGESFLFTFTPEFQVYNWTGENLYFIKGNNESLSIGAGDGKFGIWLDGDIYQGRTEACNTYGNEPLVPQRDFVVKTLECWAFL